MEPKQKLSERIAEAAVGYGTAEEPDAALLAFAAEVADLEAQVVPKGWYPQLLKSADSRLEVWWSEIEGWQWDDDDDGPIVQVPEATTRDDWRAAIAAAEAANAKEGTDAVDS